MPSGQETRIVDPTTGGAKGSKLAAFHLIPWTIIQELAEHFGRGARKYDERNWERGYKWSLSFAALHRHLAAFWDRDEIDHDPSLYEDGEAHVVRHIIAVVWHACVLAYFSRYCIGTDDRPMMTSRGALAGGRVKDGTWNSWDPPRYEGDDLERLEAQAMQPTPVPLHRRGYTDEQLRSQAGRTAP